MNRRMSALTFLIGLSLTLSGCAEEVPADDASVESADGATTRSSDSAARGADVLERTFDVLASTADGLQGEPGVLEGEPGELEDEPDDTFMPLSSQGDVVEFVEIERYMGLWYEIATTPSFQQASCFGTQAEYTFNAEQGWVDVVNTCLIGDSTGTPQQIQGTAELVDVETQAKLIVTFFGQSAPYWVVALDGSEGDEPYQWAAVSVPGKQVIWLLSRTKQMDEFQRQTIESHLTQRGFPVEDLLDTPQGD